jgi:hypothetical protein
VTPQKLLRMGLGTALLGGGLLVASAFVPYTAGSVAIEALYAVIDLSLLLGLVTIYAHETQAIGWPGLLTFVLAFAGLASIVGPDATMLGVGWYQAGATVAAIGMAGLGASLLAAGRLVAPALCWIAVPLVASFAPPPIGQMLAGTSFGVGFLIAALSILLIANPRPTEQDKG